MLRLTRNVAMSSGTLELALICDECGVLAWDDDHAAMLASDGAPCDECGDGFDDPEDAYAYAHEDRHAADGS